MFTQGVSGHPASTRAVAPIVLCMRAMDLDLELGLVRREESGDSLGPSAKCSSGGLAGEKGPPVPANDTMDDKAGDPSRLKTRSARLRLYGV